MRARLLALFCCVAAWGLARADEAQPPKPGPEQEALKKLVGDWDASVNFMGQEEKATASFKMELGGFWLVQHFKGDFGGQKFEGRGTTGYDPIKKKYVSTWIDSMSPVMMVSEGSYDKDGKTYTEIGEGVGPDGKPGQIKSVSEFQDADTLVLTMYAVRDGKDEQMMKITYKRKK